MAKIDRETAARHAARGLWADDDCEIDDDSAVTFLDEGAWVACWRLVPAEEIERVISAARASA